MALEKLRLDGVYQSFGDVPVLNGIDLSVSEGQMVCLIGPSGSGKSTLLRCINLLEPIDNGQILFCLLYTSPSPRDQRGSRMPSSA